MDGEWELIAPYVPIGRFGPYPDRLREQFEGVIWRFRTGSPWRDVPERHEAWQTVHHRFRQWTHQGVSQALMEGMTAEAAARGQVDLGLVSVDSTVVRAHHDAVGMAVDGDVLAALKKAGDDEEGGTRKAQKGRNDIESTPDPRREERRRRHRRRRARLKAAELGRSRGGLTGKVPLAADRRCRPLSFVLTPGQAADSPRFTAVLEGVRVRGRTGRPRTRPVAVAVAADKAYSSRTNRAYLRRRHIKAVIPQKADQSANRRRKGSHGGRPVGHDATLYKDRNSVERCINKIKAWRGLATRYDKTPASYLAGLHLRGAVIWIRSLQPTQ
jgi:transposase